MGARSAQRRGEGVGGDVAQVGDDASVAAHEDVPSYTVAHMVLTFEAMEGVRMQLNVNNLFNESYYRTVINSTQFIPAEGRNVQFTTSLSL